MITFTKQIVLSELTKAIKVTYPNIVVSAKGDLDTVGSKSIANDKNDFSNVPGSKIGAISLEGATVIDSELQTYIDNHTYATEQDKQKDDLYNFDNADNLFCAMCLINHQLLVSEASYAGSLSDYRNLIIAKAKTL